MKDTGFEIIGTIDLPELNATGIWAKHKKCGTEVFHVLNDDSENLFAFAFATEPQDSTGAAHILEHSVLCGSKNYPLKDAFIVLAQGSLQTFLNAWTFPDKTVYPASSVNEQDYFNLMSVYGDAVFRPLLAEWTFLQEGHRHEFDKESGRLSINGVVYNEMKGAYSSLDAYAQLWSIKSVLPDTPYSLESGGDPEQITELSWQGLKDFHNNRYSPANCRIFLAGNIPTEKQLAFLNEKFFQGMDAGTASSFIPKQQRWAAPKEFKVPCPAGGDTKPTAFLSWLCTDACDTNENIALLVLIEILLGHDGSPLTKTLLESGLGEDISPVSGFENELGETVFTIGLRGLATAEDEDGKKTEFLILETLQQLAAEGIPEEEIEAAMLLMEFSQKEIKRSGGPYSLVWMRRSLRAWLHGSNPWESLLLSPAINKIRQNLAENSRYFESLIQKYLLDNPHRAFVLVQPKEDFLGNKQKELDETLAKTEQGLSKDEKKAIEEKSNLLEEIQSKSYTPEELTVIPHLSPNSLSPIPEIIPRQHEDLQGIPALCHNLYTNGISYIDLSFPLDLLPAQDYLWLSFFARAVISVGLPGMDYAEVSSLMARTVGGFNAILHTGSAAYPNNSPLMHTPSGEFDLAGRDWIMYRIKCLDEKAEPALNLALRLIGEADFSDLRRLKDLVMEMKNELRSGFSNLGHLYASARAARFMSPSTKTGETWNGISQLIFAHQLAEMDMAEISAKLVKLRDAIAGNGLFVNLAGSDIALNAASKLIGQQFSRFGSPRARAADSTGVLHPPETQASPEVFASPSLQVGFAAMTLTAAAFDTHDQAAESVLMHYLNTGALWEDIRMKGGAYGASANSDNLERCFSLSTYRDPSPLRSLDSFSSILKDYAVKTIEKDELEKTIIGAYSRETRPRTPSEKSASDFLRYVSFIDNECRQRKLERIIGMGKNDISAALNKLASQAASGRVIITGMKDAEQAAAALGTQVQELPV